MSERRNDLEIVMKRAKALRDPTRIDLLFTMSEIPHADPVKDRACEVMFSRTIVFRSAVSARPVFALRATPGTLRLWLRSAAPREAKGEAWWSQTGSNRRPHACKARALPAELWPRTRRRMLLIARCALAFASATPQQPSFKDACRAEAAEQRRLVGLGRLELPTSRLSSARSNQLSYKPLTLFLTCKDREHARAQSRLAPDAIAQALSPWRVFVREERETKTAKSRLWSSAILKLLAPDV